MIFRDWAYSFVCMCFLVAAGDCFAQSVVPARSDYRKDAVFFVASGGPDACGKSCNEWIAVEGRFNSGTAARFREFLSSAHRRSLPVFLHSIGGGGNEGVNVGRILREFNMSVSIGRTVLKECPAITLAADKCRNLIQSGKQVVARLQDGFCNSACVFALAGGVVRKVSANAHVGIHSPNPLLPDGTRLAGPKLAESFRVMAIHLVEMGVDPMLMSAAAKIPNHRMHRLSRGEIAKYGIETKAFETSWYINRPLQGGRVQAVKAWTFPVDQGSRFMTTTLQVECVNDHQIALIVKRYGGGGETEVRFGETAAVLRGVFAAGAHQTISHYFAWEDVRRVLSGGMITLAIKLPEQGGPKIAMTPAAPLADTMPELRRSCQPRS
jgi:hypothetical protein